MTSYFCASYSSVAAYLLDWRAAAFVLCGFLFGWLARSAVRGGL